MLGQLFDGGDFAVYCCFELFAYTMFGMEDHLALHIFLEQFDYILFYLFEYLFGISHQAAGNSFDDGFEHQQVFHFGYVGDEDVLLAQIIDLSPGTAVAVDDAHRFQCMEIL